MTTFDTPAMYRVKAGQHRRRAGKTKDAKVRDHLFERAAACERQARRLEDAKNQRGAR